MKIDVLMHEEPHLHLGIKGSLDRDGARKLSRFLLSRDRRAFTRLELDLAAVDFIGLSAIATLQELCQSLQQRGGTMTLLNVSRQLKSALECLGGTPCWNLRNADCESQDKDVGG
ncbi:MAG: STAS domain-containing protein [Candidatus Aminicenantes bacterium]|nr:STAS domain-containing protein [Candidatus Aminicenantes bacterium]